MTSQAVLHTTAGRRRRRRPMSGPDIVSCSRTVLLGPQVVVHRSPAFSRSFGRPAGAV